MNRSSSFLVAAIGVAASLAACAKPSHTVSSSTATPSQTDFVAAMKTSSAQGTPLPTVSPRTPDTRFRTVDVSFVDSTRGWLLRVSDVATEIISTNDAGSTWKKQYEGAITGLRIQFVDSSRGWVVGRDACPYPPGVDCHGALLATSDGGATWTKSSPTTDWLTDVSFVDPMDGWVLAVRNCNTCEVSQLLSTTDGGATWRVEMLPSRRYSLGRRQLFRFGNRGVITGRDDVIVSDDGGANWSARDNGCDPRSFLYLAWFSNSLDGWSVCGDGRAGGTQVEKFIYATSNGGGSWQLRSQFLWAGETPPGGIGEAPASSVEDVTFTSDQTGWMATVFGLYRTRNGGSTWAPAADLGADTIARLLFVNQRIGFALASALWVTTDGGEQWQQRPLPQ